MTDLPPPIVESPAVQAARMEGKIDRIFDRVDDLRGDVREHTDHLGRNDEKLDNHGSRIQSLEEGAVADKKPVTATALALSEAQEKVEKAAKAEADKADKSWKPIQYLGWFIGAAMVLIEIFQRISATS